MVFANFPAGTTADIADRLGGPGDGVPPLYFGAQCAVCALEGAFWLSRHPSLSWLAAVFHVSCVGLLTYAAVKSAPRGGDISLQVLSILATLFFGMAGSAAAVLMLLGARRKENALALQEWRQRLRGREDPSQAQRLYSKIVNGRARRLDVRPPQDFALLLERGPLRDIQRALGRIALDYHPDYIPVLDASLQCQETTVRVQAAAIIVSLRSQVKARLKAVANSRVDSSARAAAGLVELRSCMASKLLEHADMQEAAALAKKLCHYLIESDPANAAPHEATLCELLFEEGDYAGFLLRHKRLSQPPEHLQRLRFASLMKLGSYRELKNTFETRGKSGGRSRRNSMEFTSC